ncbi:MAG: N-ethylammeline chlorohydrolase [Mesorhizobium sp.]|uniref:amidohydrolase family protein n=1 Tax=unclassified Mesorhizobium TaxID=325217 RepID=UPI00109CF980|nr:MULTISPECIES: amidohydrolase family protein [unclassified Mesorhizobium]TGQ77066.1 N-ethylammeline chlorohydrolase [Mesorhizobium sp. M8A.F.Ca.ET.207.01.1.1]TIT34542.1 MAG: N-ethylammeline chlorohydrolase [Mesorhizobium sp.]
MTSPSKRILMTADWVVGHEDGRHTLLPGGQIVYQGATILFVGHDFSGEVDERVDCGQALIAPGFIDLDALSDLDTTILSFDNHPAWAKGRVWPKTYMDAGPYEMYSPEELVFQKRHAFARLIRNGVTTALPIASLYYRQWGETVEEFEGAADAAADLGLRVYLGPAYRTGNPFIVEEGKVELFFDEPRGLAGLDDAVTFCERLEGRNGGLVRTMLAPDRIETCTAELLRRTAAAGRDLDVPVRLHCCQGGFERETVRRLHGMTSVEWLQSLDFLTEKTLLPHGTFVSPSRFVREPGRDLDIIAENGSIIVHCPLVAARFGDGLESFKTYRKRGLRIGLGTDTSPPDMLLNMQTGLMVCRFVEGEAQACRAEDYFDAATLGGADALGRADLGRLAPSCRADMVVWDLSNPDLGQVIDPIQTLMISGSGRDARTVVIDGRMVMRDREIPTMDYAAETARAQRQFNTLMAKYPERTLGNPPTDEIFSSAYRVIPRAP